jgi:archaemetzincin
MTGARMANSMKLNVLLTATRSLQVEDARYAINVLESKLGQLFTFELNTLTIAPPAEDYSEERKQYSAEAFLPEAEELKTKNGCFSSIILTDVDIFAKFTNYVFGLADMVHRVAVVSSHRIHPSFWGAKETREFFEEQWGKVVSHEFGHTIGLLHCDNRDCVMKYSNSPAELYEKGKTFCNKCGRELENIIQKLASESKASC